MSAIKILTCCFRGIQAIKIFIEESLNQDIFTKQDIPDVYAGRMMIAKINVSVQDKPSSICIHSYSLIVRLQSKQSKQFEWVGKAVDSESY